MGSQRQNDKCGDDCRGDATAGVHDCEEAQDEQRRVQCEERDQQAQVDRRMREHYCARRQRDRRRQRKKNGRTTVRSDDELAEPRQEHREQCRRHRSKSRTR